MKFKYPSFLIAYCIKSITLFLMGRFPLYLFIFSWQHSNRDPENGLHQNKVFYLFPYSMP
jgi:hypothetical protein